MAGTPALPLITDNPSAAKTVTDYTTAGSNFLDLLLGKTTTTTTGTDIDPAAVQNMLQGLLETGTGGIQGLAGILGSQKGAGLYNSSTAGLLSGNLIAKVIAEVLGKTAKTTTTQQSGQAQAKAAQSALGAGAGAGALAAAVKAFNAIDAKGLESLVNSNTEKATEKITEDAGKLASEQIKSEFEKNLEKLDEKKDGDLDGQENSESSSDSENNFDSSNNTNVNFSGDTTNEGVDAVLDDAFFNTDTTEEDIRLPDESTDFS